MLVAHEKNEGLVTQSVHANVCCKRLFGRYTDQVSRAPASIQFSPPPTSPRSALLPLREQRSPRLCRCRRENRKTYARQVVASYAERGDAIDILIGVVRRIQIVRKTFEPVVRCSFCRRRCLRWTSNSASDWKGYSLTGRKVLQRFCARGSPKDGSPRTESSRGCQLFDRDGRGYATLAKNAQDAKVWKAGIRNIVDG